MLVIWILPLAVWFWATATTVISSEGATSTTDNGSAASPSGPGQLSTTPTASAQTATGLTLTEGSTVYTGTPGSSKPTVTSNSTDAKEDAFSASPSRPGKSFSTGGGHGQTTTSSPPGFTFYTTTSEVSTPPFSAHPSYSTDKASPASPSSPSELYTPTVASEHTTTTFTEGPTIYTTVSTSSQYTVSSYSSHPTGMENSTASSSPGEASTSSVGLGLTTSSVNPRSTGHSTISDYSQYTDSSATTIGNKSRTFVSSLGDSFTTSSGDGPLPMSTPEEPLVSTTISESSKHTVSSQNLSSSTRSSLDVFSTTSLTTGHNATTFTEFPSVFPSISEMSKSTAPSGSSYTREAGSAASPSSSRHLSTTPTVSAQTTETFTEESTVYTGTLGLSKHTVNSDSTTTKEDGFSPSTLNPIDSFTTKGDNGQMTTSFLQGSTFYKTTAAFSTEFSYRTDKSSPASPSSPSEVLATHAVSKQTSLTPTEGPTVYSTFTAFSKSTVISEAFHTTDTESSTDPLSPGEVSISPVVPGLMTTIVTQKSTGHSPISEWSQHTDSSATTFTKEEGSPGSTSSPGESFITSSGYGQSGMPFTVESMVSTILSDSPNPTVSPDKFHTTDMASHPFPSGPGESSISTRDSGQTATALTEEVTLYTHISDLSIPTVYHVTSHSTNTGSAASSSGPGQLSTTLTASEQSTIGLFEGSTVYTSKPTVTLDSVVTKEDGFSASTSRPGESFATETDHGHVTTSFSTVSTFYTTSSEVSTPAFTVHPSYSTDKASPASPSSPRELSTHNVASEHTTTALVEESTMSLSPESTASSEASQLTGTWSPMAPSGPGDSPTASSGGGHITRSFIVEPTVSTALPNSPNPTVSPDIFHTDYTASPSSPSGPGESSASTQASGKTAMTFAKETSLYTHILGLSTTSVSLETSSPRDDGSAASPSGPGQLSTTPTATGTAVYTGTPDLSKSTVTVEMMVTKENGFSASTLNPTESFTTSGGEEHSTTTFPRGSTFYTISSDLSTSIFPTHASYNTDSARPAPPPSPTELSTSSVVPEQTTALTKETAIFVTFSDSSQSTVSPYSSHPIGTGSSAASSSSGEAATNSAVSGPTAATVALKPTGHSTISDSSQPTDSSTITFTKEGGNPVSASSPGESFTTSAVDGPTALHPATTFYTVISQVSTPTLSTHPAYSTASPASLSGLSTPTVLSEQTTMIPTERLTVYTSISDLSKSTVSSETSFTRSEGSSVSSSSSGQLSTTTGVSQHSSSTLSEGSAVYTVTHEFKTTVTSDTTLPKEDASFASTSSSGESFSTIGGYQKTPTLSIPVESTVSAVLSDSPLPTVPHDTVYTTEDASLSSPSGAGELISTTLVSGQTLTSLPQASNAHTDVSDSSHPMSSAVPSSTINRNPVSISSPGELSSITLISGQTTTVFTEKPTLYTTVSVVSGPVVSGGATSTPPRGGPASLPSSGPSPSTTVTTFAKASVFTTTTYSSSTGASPDAPNTAEDLNPSSSSSPIHSSSSPATSGNIPTTLGEDSTLFITSSGSTKPTVSTSIPSATDNPSPASPSILTPSSTTTVISRPKVTTLSGGSTVFPSGVGSPSPTMSPDSCQTTVPSASSSASAIPDFSSRPAPDYSSAIRTSGFSPPQSSTSLGPRFSTASAPHPLSTGTRTTVVTSHSPAMTTGQCQLGTTWNGKECVCEQGFFGDQCKSLVDSFFLEIPEKINATVGVTVKVTNRNFTEDLNNASSQAYWNFIQLFNSQMDKAYMGKDFPQYRGVIVKRLLNGSIVVDHDVVLEANYTSEFEKLFKNLTEIVRAKIMNETKSVLNDSEKCKAPSNLCYSEEATTVSTTVKLGFDLQEQCTQKAAKEFAQFYYVDELKGKLACVTNCTEGAKLQLNCHEGKCQMQRSGPRCLCPTSDTHWYWGETCELQTSKSLVYGSVGAAVGLLVLVVVVLTVFLGRSQRKLRRKEYNLSREWQEEDIPGSFQNTDIWEGDDLKEDKFSLKTLYSRFRPSLKKVDPSTELHIQRPRVVTTAQ
nr:mucin-12 isoform X1 [Manis javanica]